MSFVETLSLARFELGLGTEEDLLNTPRTKLELEAGTGFPGRNRNRAVP